MGFELLHQLYYFHLLSTGITGIHITSRFAYCFIHQYRILNSSVFIQSSVNKTTNAKVFRDASTCLPCQHWHTDEWNRKTPYATDCDKRSIVARVAYTNKASTWETGWTWVWGESWLTRENLLQNLNKPTLLSGEQRRKWWREGLKNWVLDITL